jgi:OOP family OmpA-OmpF porin
LYFLISGAASADETESICNVDRPISTTELRSIFEECEIPVGTRISMKVEEIDSQPPKPGVGFRPNDIELNQNGKDTLDSIVSLLLVRKKLQVKVVGYADTTEQGDLVGLSYRRAEVASQYIISKGIDPTRVTIVAGGVEVLIDHSGTQDGRARNRRVEFVLSAS